MLTGQRQRVPLLLAAVASAWLSGCAEPDRMFLGEGSTGQTGSFRWWHVDLPGNAREAIVGIEFPHDGARTEQWILAANGVRQYEFTGRKLTSVGPPMPPFETTKDFATVRNWLTYSFPPKAPDAQIPDGDIADARCMIDIVKIMQTHCAGHQGKPPAEMTGGDLAYESEYFPRDVWVLLAAVQNVLKR